jgi:hypothetical protein
MSALSNKERGAADTRDVPFAESASSGGARPGDRLLHYLDETGGLWQMKL